MAPRNSPASQSASLRSVVIVLVRSMSRNCSASRPSNCGEKMVNRAFTTYPSA